MPDIQTILANEDFGHIVTTLCVDTIEGRETRDYYNEFNGERKRRKTSVGWREPKKLEQYSDTLLDTEGNPVRLDDKIIDVARIVTNFPKKEVRTAVAFMFGGRMVLNAENRDDGFEEFKRVFDKKLKMHSVFKKFARKVLSETKAALVFYPYATKDLAGRMITELRVKILSLPRNEYVDSDFYPHFDDNDDMDAFIHRFNVPTEDQFLRQKVIIYTEKEIITGVDSNEGWIVKKVPNLFGKIPVVYAEVDYPDWDEVATLMDAREMRLSRLADTNDYFAEPTIVTYGESNLPGKNTVGKEIQFPMEVDPDTGKEYHGDAKVLAWDQSINSTDKELQETKSEMFGGVSMADLSMNNLTGLGNLSGVSRRFMTLDTEIRSAEHMETFGPVVQRCISVVASGIANITNIKYRNQILSNWITASFESILPKDPVEEAQVLSIANGGKAFNSIETTVARSPLTASGEVDAELERMAKEQEEESKRNSLVGANFGGY